MEIFRNGELIGYNHYFFNRNGSETIVTNQINFEDPILGWAGNENSKKRFKSRYDLWTLQITDTKVYFYNRFFSIQYGSCN